MSSVEVFQYHDWMIELHRRAGRASLTINVYPHKPIRVLVARTTSQRVILEFLNSRKPWIEASLKKFENLPKPEKKKFQNNEIFPFMGRSLKLKPVITLNRKRFISATDTELLVHIPRNDWSASILRQGDPDLLADIRVFYKREAIKELTNQVAIWAQRMGLQPKQLRFREQRTRWGSCSSRGNINLNWRLIVFKPEVISYVIVHELAHLQHMDHSAHFWNLVEKHMPSYEPHIIELREKLSHCEFLGAR